MFSAPNLPEDLPGVSPTSKGRTVVRSPLPEAASTSRTTRRAPILFGPNIQELLTNCLKKLDYLKTLPQPSSPVEDSKIPTPSFFETQWNKITSLAEDINLDDREKWTFEARFTRLDESAEKSQGVGECVHEATAASGTDDSSTDRACSVGEVVGRALEDPFVELPEVTEIKQRLLYLDGALNSALYMIEGRSEVSPDGFDRGHVGGVYWGEKHPFHEEQVTKTIDEISKKLRDGTEKWRELKEDDVEGKSWRKRSGIRWWRVPQCSPSVNREGG